MLASPALQRKLAAIGGVESFDALEQNIRRLQGEVRAAFAQIVSAPPA